MSRTSDAARYGGTGGTLVRTGGWALLLDVAPDHPLVDLCWQRLGATTELDDLLEALVAQGLAAVPSFALVRETGVRQVVGRGALALVLDRSEVVRVEDAGREAGGWVDLSLADVGSVEVALTVAGATGASLPLRDGVVAATGFRLVLEDDGVTERRRDRAASSSEDTLPATFTSGLVALSESRPAAGARVPARRTAARADDDVEAPRVLAAVCPAGHLTPAYSGVCRVCRQVVPAQDAFETARPVLGRLVLPLGGSVVLDRGAVLGRAPYVPADWAGTEPRLVALPDPDQDVSAQHVSVVLDLWNVLVYDLGSTNGTTLVDQGGQTRPLRPYEPAALAAGDAIVLADVVTVPFEVQP